MTKLKFDTTDKWSIAIFYAIIVLVLILFDKLLSGFTFSNPFFIWLSANKIWLLFIISLYLVFQFSSSEIQKKNLAIQNLLVEEQKYLQLFHHANDAIILLSGDKVVDCNTKTFDLLNRNRFQVINRSILELSAKKQVDGTLSAEKFWQILKIDDSEDKKSIYWLFISPEGRFIDAAITVTQINILKQSYNQLIIKDISKQIESKIQIRESERKYQDIVESANSVIVKFDLQGKITFINKYCEQVFGYKKQETIDRYFFDVFKKRPKANLYTQQEVSRLMHRVLRNITTQPTHEHWNYTKLGKKVFMSWTSKPIYDYRKNLIGILSIGTDQTEDKIIYDRLMQSQQKFRTVFNEISEGITILSHHGRIIELNNVALNFFGFQRSDIEDYASVLNKLKSTIPNFNKLVSDVKAKGEISAEMDVLSARNELIHAEIVAKLSKLGGKPVIIVVSRNITERKNQQQLIFNVALEAEEKERSRVAKELHDSVSPTLSASKLYTQTLHDAKSEELKKQIIEKIEFSIDETIQSIYEISNNLSPHILENFGLIEAINSFIDKIPADKVNIAFNCNFNQRLSKNIEITLYRVVSELINNSLKHASAKNIVLRLIIIDNNLLINFTDDGVGFDKKQVLSSSKGMGIFNITNRINSINGKIDIKSKPENGIDINIRIPMN